MDYLSPFEAAAGCDVLGVAAKYPDLLISGGIDKRIIAEGGDTLRRYLDKLMPPLRKRGGYIPRRRHSTEAFTVHASFN